MYHGDNWTKIFAYTESAINVDYYGTASNLSMHTGYVHVGRKISRVDHAAET